MSKIILFAILLSTSFVCFGQNKDEPQNAVLKLEACEVYKAVLGNEKPLVISESIIQHLEFGSRWAFSKRNPKLANIQNSTVKSYKKDSYWCEIKDFVNLEPKKVLITQDEINSFFEKLKVNRDADLPFIEKYNTDHYYEFSNVGFNKMKNQALLTVKWQRISFTGSDTYYVILTKVNNEWEITGKENIESS